MQVMLEGRTVALFATQAGVFVVMKQATALLVTAVVEVVVVMVAVGTL